MSFVGLIWVASLSGDLVHNQPIADSSQLNSSPSPASLITDETLESSLVSPHHSRQSRWFSLSRYSSYAPVMSLLSQGLFPLDWRATLPTEASAQELALASSRNTTLTLEKNEESGTQRYAITLLYGEVLTSIFHQTLLFDSPVAESTVNIKPSRAALDPKTISAESEVTPDLAAEWVTDWQAWSAIADVHVLAVPTQPTSIQSTALVPTTAQTPTPKSCLALPHTSDGAPVAAPVATTAGLQTTHPTSHPTVQYQLWIKDQLIGEIADEKRAYVLAHRLRHLIQDPSFSANDIQPFLGEGFAAAKVGDEILFVIDDSMTINQPDEDHWVALNWVNQLRVALGGQSIDLATLQMRQQNLVATRHQFQGTASWYGPNFHGRQTATGEIFNQHDLTAAHPTLPFNTYLKIRNLRNNKTVVVRVNDRGPYVGTRTLDLSQAAARCLGSETVGVIPYEATVLRPIQPDPSDDGSALVTLRPVD